MCPPGQLELGVSGRVRQAPLPVPCLGQHSAVTAHEHRAEGVVTRVESFSRELDAAVEVGAVVGGRLRHSPIVPHAFSRPSQSALGTTLARTNLSYSTTEGAISAETDSSVRSSSTVNTRSPVILPADRRSAVAISACLTRRSGPVTSTRVSSVRMETFAVDLAPRIPASAAAMASTAAPSAAPAEPSSLTVGHADRWTEPSCHHDQTSSVT